VEAPRTDLLQAFLVAVLFVGIMLSIVVVYDLFVRSRTPASPVTYAVLPPNTVVFVHFGDFNVEPYRGFAESHGLVFYDLNVDDPEYYLLLGERRIPLIPPVISLPAYMCLDVNDVNRVIGYAGPDFNVYRLVVSKCFGYVGPAYVLDENGHVVEVNA